MRMVLLSVFDVQAQAFMRPIFVAARGVGVRMVTDEVNRSAPDNLMFHHPEDFRVFELGSWDDSSGLFSVHALPELVADCSSLRVPV